MATESDHLPSQEELDEIFRDFKQVLQAVRFKTPLQRANHVVMRNGSIALAQRTQSEAEHVFNLLKPGHGTELNVDFFRLMLKVHPTITLSIPITLLSVGERIVLLKNNECGQITLRSFHDSSIALHSFLDEISKTHIVRASLPRIVHKISHQPCSFHLSAETAAEAWHAGVGSQQRLQQYVLPRGQNTSLLRVHWRMDRKSVYYLITQGCPPEKSLPPLAQQMRLINHSFSEAFLIDTRSRIKKTTAHLLVQRLKTIPGITSSLETCLKVLSGALPSDQQIKEMVCDFTANCKGEWVFLGCDGFSRKSRSRDRTKVVTQKEVLNLQSLMFPLVARKSVVCKQIRKSQILSILEDQHHTSVTEDSHSKPKQRAVSTSVSHSLIEFSRDDSACVSLYSQSSKRKAIVESLLTTGVSHYDSMLKESRAYKEEINKQVDFVEKHGGIDVWRRKLQAFMSIVPKLPEVSDLFQENIGIEETEMIVCGILRVITGDYNFYYKEALKRVHHRKCILASQYELFLAGIEDVFFEITQSESESQLIFQRLKQFQPFICRPLPPSSPSTPLQA